MPARRAEWSPAPAHERAMDVHAAAAANSLQFRDTRRGRSLGALHEPRSDSNVFPACRLAVVGLQNNPRQVLPREEEGHAAERHTPPRCRGGKLLRQTHRTCGQPKCALGVARRCASMRTRSCAARQEGRGAARGGQGVRAGQGCCCTPAMMTPGLRQLWWSYRLVPSLAQLWPAIRSFSSDMERRASGLRPVARTG